MSLAAQDCIGWQPRAGAARLTLGTVRSLGTAQQMLEMDRHEESARGSSERWAALMSEAQQGNKQAYARILKEITPYIQSLVRRFHLDPETVEDVVQDTLLTIHRVRHTYEPGRSVHAWVAAIARRRVIDNLRMSRRHRVGAESMDMHDPPDERANHGEAYAHRAQLDAAMQLLPASQREAMRLLKVEQYTLEEASQITGQTALALKSLVHRAVKTLRERFAGEQDG